MTLKNFLGLDLALGQSHLELLLHSFNLLLDKGHGLDLLP